MPTRNVVITDRQDELLGELVASGRYQNVSEAMREGLRLLAEKIETRKAELKSIRSGLTESLEQESRGEFATGSAEEVIRRAFEGRKSKAR